MLPTNRVIQRVSSRASTLRTRRPVGQLRPDTIIPAADHAAERPARRVADLGAAAALPDRRVERRRRVAEPDLDFREFCRRSKLPQSERSWDLFAGERYRRGETDIPSYEAYNPFRHSQQGPYA